MSANRDTTQGIAFAFPNNKAINLNKDKVDQKCRKEADYDFIAEVVNIDKDRWDSNAEALKKLRYNLDRLEKLHLELSEAIKKIRDKNRKK